MDSRSHGPSNQHNNGPTSLKVLSWNIHDGSSIEGKKVEDATFLNILSQADVFCLQETKQDIKIPNYRCYNSLRPDSRSGGVCLGIRNNLLDILKPIKTHEYSSDFQAFTISKQILGTPKDVIIINVYDSPATSSYKTKKAAEGDTTTTLSNLDAFCNSLPDDVLFFVVGDMNARTGTSATVSANNNLVIQQLIEGTFPTHSSLPKRNSKDATLNESGKQLIDFGCEWNLKILNGASVGDLLGDWTCYRYNGSSVVDYMMVSHSLHEHVSYFKVLDLTVFSDHRPLLCYLHAAEKRVPAISHEDQFENKPLGYKWVSAHQESKIKFLDCQKQADIAQKISSVATVTCSEAGEVYDLNKKLVDVFRSIADHSLKKRRQPKCSRRPNKKVWFDDECRQLKRLLNRLARKYSKNPEDDQQRVCFYETKKHYRHVIRLKKSRYYSELNSEIQQNNKINWEGMKKLKMAKKDPEQLDLHDLSNFYEFFKKLYDVPSTHTSDSDNTCSVADCLQNEHLIPELQNDMNSPITIDELDSAIRTLRKGKAAGEDCISNEFLLYSNTQLRLAILNLFNQCLNNGVYPWNTSIVTPLHKKGDRYNPDNYRAIAVSSAIGKLFSNVLLKRLVNYRLLCCPDPPNQLGFCKEAQTVDHIFTLETCISKYIKQGKRLYSCFIDFKKAFDSVQREALLFKLSQLNIKGKFFDCIHHMYSHSRAKIKMMGKLSEAIKVQVGTEQGHPMSPELFKIFLLDLSYELNNTIGNTIQTPELNNTSLSHLLWADDLVLLALDRTSLQHLINVVHHFCNRWGLEVNIGKTAILVFNKSGRLLKESFGLKYGDLDIPTDKTYCYLGITVTLSGSLAKTMDVLRMKGLRALFALKSLININELKTSPILKLFDALLLPVASYGSPVWMHRTMFVKEILSNRWQTNPNECLKRMARDPIERLHLKFLKWSLGIHKKASNIFCWGDTGRCPVIQKISKQAVDYFQRLNSMRLDNINSLARHSFEEQRNLNLPWYENMVTLLSDSQSAWGNTDSRLRTSSTAVKEILRNKFNIAWNTALTSSSKLEFYRQLKNEPCFESYLDIRNRAVRKSLAQLRSSSHRLNIETARYLDYNVHGVSKSKSKISLSKEWSRCCKFCCTPDVELLQQLPFAEKPIVEDERHVLVSCPAYHHLRIKLNDHIKSSILAWDERVPSLFEVNTHDELGLYVHRIFQQRFPKQNK